MVLFRDLFSRRWIIASLLAVSAVIIMIRLGLWQLDRLEQRREFNRAVLATRDLPPLELGSEEADDLSAQTYRKAYVRGEYDEANQVVLSNQSYRDQLGVHLLTPLRIEGTDQHFLVDRGWVPFEHYLNGTLDQYETDGVVEVRGILVGTTSRIGVRSCLEGDSAQSGAPENSPLALWCVDLEKIQAGLPYEITNLYLVREPVSAEENPPVGTTVQIEITEGPHLGYAVQWFSFAVLLAIGYPYYVSRDRKARADKAAMEARESQNTKDEYNPQDAGLEGSGR
jgi:surfeit locus 1 family protein